MFCPGCGAEFEPGVVTCPECGVELVEERPADFEPQFQETVKVFESADPGQIAVAESVLQGAEIPYVVQNAASQTTLNALTRDTVVAYIEVEPEYADEAIDLLADLSEPIDEEDLEEYAEEDYDEAEDEEEL